jgi:hypothetical protein
MVCFISQRTPSSSTRRIKSALTSFPRIPTDRFSSLNQRFQSIGQRMHSLPLGQSAARRTALCAGQTAALANADALDRQSESSVIVGLAD